MMTLDHLVAMQLPNSYYQYAVDSRFYVLLWTLHSSLLENMFRLETVDSVSLQQRKNP